MNLLLDLRKTSCRMKYRKCTIICGNSEWRLKKITSYPQGQLVVKQIKSISFPEDVALGVSWFKAFLLLLLLLFCMMEISFFQLMLTNTIPLDFHFLPVFTQLSQTEKGT